MATGGWLAELEDGLAAVDLDVCSSSQLTDHARGAAQGKRLLEGFLTRVAAAAHQHADDDPGAPAPEDVTRGGRKGSSKKSAQKTTRRARALRLLPLTAETFAAGQIRPECVDHLVKTLNGQNHESRLRVTATDPVIAKAAVGVELGEFCRWLRTHIERLDRKAGLGKLERQRTNTGLRFSSRADGTFWLSGEYDPERGEQIRHRVRQVARQLAELRGLPMSDALQAEALWLIVTRDGTTDQPARPGVGYLTDLSTLREGSHPGTVAETWTGNDIPAETIERARCDADLYAVVFDDDHMSVSVGHTHRRATLSQRLALRSLYPDCPLSGEPFEWCEVHHVTRWPDGPTDLENLLPVSTQWHHRLHEGGWTLKLASDRTIKLFRPDGSHDRTIPPPEPIHRRPRDGP
ncbi:MAG: hypothetical protein GY745_11970 [Actinomycetia bacterium]|nr:hypothetical protein [Actinomycetes bacterium]MCP4085756.1 hypothetical protein [Actinomycetes bacterium]